MREAENFLLPEQVSEAENFLLPEQVVWGLVGGESTRTSSYQLC